MKIRTFLILLTVTTTFTIQHLQAQVSIGLKGGISGSSLYGDDAVDTDPIGGMVGGLFLNLNSGGIFSLQPELLYTSKGGINSHQRNNTRQEIRTDYLEVPVLFKLQIPVTTRFYPHAFIGPYFGWRMSGNYTTTQINPNLDVGTQDINMKGADYGGVVGGGFDIHGDRLFFTCDGRYGFGVTSIDRGNYYRSPLDLRNSTFTLSAGLGFKF